MRYAVLSDIHGNREALGAVLEAMAGDNTDACLFVGDLVGYGADARACVADLAALKPQVLIAGNHDWGVLNLLGMDYFNEYAAAAVAWTKKALRPKELEYLKSFKLVFEDEKMTIVHGALDRPAKFNYVLDAEDAAVTLRLSRTPVCFVGHSHAPGIFRLDDQTAHSSDAGRITMEAGNKYLVNVGSVGQPRDGDPRACYAIYDDEAATVEIKRVTYDIEKAQAKIVKAGLPAWLAARLAEGR